MNRENIKRVRDVIAGLEPSRFTMEYYAAETDGPDVPAVKLAHTCNTAGCIAGWTVAALAKRVGRNGVQFQANRLLGLDWDTGDDLFCPPGYDTPRKYSQPHAVRVLDHLLETGEVDWAATRSPKKTPKPSAQDTSGVSDKVPGRTT